MDDEEIGKLLKDSDTPVEYPRDLKTATRAEFVTMVNKMDDKPGCPLMIMCYILMVLSTTSILLSLS